MKFIVFTTILGLIFSFGDMIGEKNGAWAEQIVFLSANKDSGEGTEDIWTIHSDGKTDSRLRTVLTHTRAGQLGHQMGQQLPSPSVKE